VKIDANILPADGKIRPFITGYQWSLDYDGGTEDLDQIRCDTTDAGPGTGCVFVNHAPTYIINAKAFPQAAAHAWLIQKATPKHLGSMDDQKPLYYMGDSAQNSRNRNRICPTGWAAANGDASALVDAADALNCDEFAFASFYNSGGMSSAEGGLSPALLPGGTTPTGAVCIGTYAKKHGSMVHPFFLNGTDPTFLTAGPVLPGQAVLEADARQLVRGQPGPSTRAGSAARSDPGGRRARSGRSSSGGPSAGRRPDEPCGRSARRAGPGGGTCPSRRTTR